MINPRSYPKLDTANDQKNYFLSGLLVPTGKTISLDPGTKLFYRFKIKGHLGNGRSGAVYVAEDILRSAEGAVKVVKIESSMEDVLHLHLLREILIQDKNFDLKHIILGVRFGFVTRHRNFDFIRL